MSLSYQNQIKFLNDIYTNLNSKFSQAYLSGSDWYIGDSLIDNPKFVYPPDDLLIMYGFKKKNIEKSLIIINILTRHLSICLKGNDYLLSDSSSDNIISNFISNYDIDLNLLENIYKKIFLTLEN